MKPKQSIATRDWLGTDAMRLGRCGAAMRLYSNSLSIAFVVLFLASFIAHAIAGAHARNEETLAHGGREIGVLEYLREAQFWFESFQNWQSEFLAIAAMVILSIFLRQRGSPESKPVEAPHSQTGSEWIRESDSAHYGPWRTCPGPGPSRAHAPSRPLAHEGRHRARRSVSRRFC